MASALSALRSRQPRTLFVVRHANLAVRIELFAIASILADLAIRTTERRAGPIVFSVPNNDVLHNVPLLGRKDNLGQARSSGPASISLSSCAWRRSTSLPGTEKARGRPHAWSHLFSFATALPKPCGNGLDQPCGHFGRHSIHVFRGYPTEPRESEKEGILFLRKNETAETAAHPTLQLVRGNIEQSPSPTPTRRRRGGRPSSTACSPDSGTCCARRRSRN